MTKNTQEANKDQLSSSAYGGVSGEEYQPFVQNNSGLAEGSWKSIFIGIILAILFAGSNTYLGLTAGMTVAGGIPGAILGSGLLYLLFRKRSILEGNIMQTMSSGGESIASGLIFVLPAIVIIGGNIDIMEAFIASFMGLIIGSFIVILVRKYLIVQSHGELIYPESMAISEVLATSNNTSGSKMKKLIGGAVLASTFKIFGSDALNFFNSYPTKIFTYIKAQIGVGLSPALIGVGYIVGIEVAFAMLAGTLLANFAFAPLFGFFGDLVPNLIVFPSSIPLSEMAPSAITSKYIRYIGAGVIATGGLISIVKILPTIFSSVKSMFEKVSISTSDQYNKDISLKLLALLVLVSFFVIAFIPNNIWLGLIVATLTILASFLFSVVGSRMAGILGTSNLPVSGMTIASLLIITPVFALGGYTDISSMSIVLLLGSVVVIAIATSGGFSQSLKVGFILGGKNKIVESAFLLASFFGLIVVLSLIIVLDKVYGFKSVNTILIAPQANLMALIVSGITSGDLPWVFILCGVAIAIVLAILKLPIMSVAIGFYLPITTVMAVVCGGIIKWIVERKYSKSTKEDKDEIVNNGIVVASGLVAGEALIGLSIAIIALIIGSVDPITSIGLNALGDSIVNSSYIGFGVFLLFLTLFYRSLIKK